MTLDTKPETKPHALIASDRVEGTAVRRPNGETIGTVERLMIDKISGTVAYAVLSFGGFFGLGEKHLPIPWAKLTYDPAMNAYQVSISDDDSPRRRPTRRTRSSTGATAARSARCTIITRRARIGGFERSCLALNRST